METLLTESKDSENHDRNDHRPKLCYYMMSMEGDSCWQHHVEHPLKKQTRLIDQTPLKIGRLKTGVFDVKAHLTVQILKALQTFQQVDKYTFAKKIFDKKKDLHPRCICHSDLHVDNILVSQGEGVYRVIFCELQTLLALSLI